MNQAGPHGDGAVGGAMEAAPPGTAAAPGERMVPLSLDGSQTAGWAGVLAIVILPAMVAVVVFVNTLPNNFAYDDIGTLEELRGVAASPWWCWARSGRGLTYAVHLLDRWLWGSWPAGFHLTNIVLHAIASALAAYGALSLTSSHRASLLCGLLFAVHPVHVEAVASFAFRKDILAMVFGMLALVLWISPRRSLLSSVGAVGCLGLAVLSKEVAAVGIIPMLLAADMLVGREGPSGGAGQWRRASVRFLPLLVIAVVAAVALAGNLPERFSARYIHYEIVGQLSSYREVVIATLAWVPERFRLLLFPRLLSVDYPVMVEPTHRLLAAILGGGLVVGWLAAAWLLVRRAPVVAFALAWTVVTYLPCSNIVPLTQFFVAERYLYVPSFGVCLLAAVAIESVWVSAAGRFRTWRRVAVAGLAAALVLAGATRSFVRNRDWRDDLTLLSSALRDGIQTARIYNLLGTRLTQQGRFQEALDYLHRAEAMREWNPVFRLNMAIALSGQGRLDEAALCCRQVLEAEARASQDRFVQTRCHLVLGQIHQQQKKWSQAITHYERVLADDPHSAEALQRLAWIRATCPEDGLRDGAKAVEYARAACLRTDHQDPWCLRVLAVAYASTGQFEQASRAALQARDAAVAMARRPGSPQELNRLFSLVQESEALSQRFAASQPYPAPR